ncbi:MAG: hypothetical protein IPF55_08275 [Rhodoferax sp.]|nr:hypothetical protein [Rhodoferax sp.]
MKKLKKLSFAARRRWMGGAVGLGLLVLLGAGAVTQSALTSHERTQHEPPGVVGGPPILPGRVSLVVSRVYGWSQDGRGAPGAPHHGVQLRPGGVRLV